jgi:hypothetical protein
MYTHTYVFAAYRGLQKTPFNIDAVPNPLHPHLKIVSLNPESAAMFASAVYPCVIEFTLKSEHENQGEKSKNILSLSGGDAEDVGETSTETAAATANLSADHIQSEAKADGTVQQAAAASVPDSSSLAVEDSSSVAESFIIADGGIATSSDHSESVQQGTQDVQKPSTSSTPPSSSSSPPQSKAQPPKRTTKIMFKSGERILPFFVVSLIFRLSVSVFSGYHCLPLPTILLPYCVLIDIVSTVLTLRYTVFFPSRVQLLSIPYNNLSSYCHLSSGDDLRQDQLIMQMIALMDRLLKKVNLDLKLHTYGILATGQNDGIMEFVPGSMAVSAILKEFRTITGYLKHHNPDKNGPYEIAPMYVYEIYP